MTFFICENRNLNKNIKNNIYITTETTTFYSFNIILNLYKKYTEEYLLSILRLKSSQHQL